MRKATTIKKILGITTDNEIIMVEDLFEYSDDFKGATGYRIGTLTQDQIDSQLEPEAVVDLWEDAVEGGYTTKTLTEWAKEMNEKAQEQGSHFYTDDPSFRQEMDDAYNELPADQKAGIKAVVGEKGKDFVDWDGLGCGRCVPTDPAAYKLILDPDLLQKVQEYEGVKA